MRQIVLDTETTGLSTAEGHRIIEIGCVELVNRKFTGKRYHQYINPQREIDQEAQTVHGITNQFLVDKPVFSKIVEEFMQFISGAELIIHNAPFDTGFINYELTLASKNWKSLSKYCRVVDSLVLAKQLHIGQRNSLDALCKRYSIDNSRREFHGALLDAHLLAQVYLAMTGGQGSLFDEPQFTDATDRSARESQHSPISRQSGSLQVIMATAEELKAHDELLQKIQKKGKCVWLSDSLEIAK